MLHVVTIHWQSPRWIDPQLAYLSRNLSGPHRVVASLNGITDPAMWRQFDVAVELEGTHAEKLNALAALVLDQAEPNDRLVFLDGDAFPVRPVDVWIDGILRGHPLAAVRRDENLGDRQPHPCFTVTTCGFWAELGGDWREGGTWTNSAGDTTSDVGGTLLHQLAAGGHDWLPLLRTNTHNPEPLWFGVYGHRVYHHGAGFRPPVSRVGDHAEQTLLRQGAATAWGTSLEGLARRVVRRPSLVKEVRPSALRDALMVTVGKRTRRWHERRRARRLRRAEDRQRAVYAALMDDPEFFLAFDDSPV